jgi:hypothetical protein
MGSRERSAWRGESEKVTKREKGDRGREKVGRGSRKRKAAAGKRSTKGEDIRRREAEERRIEELERQADSISRRQSVLSDLLAKAEELSDSLEHDSRSLTRHLSGDPRRGLPSGRGGVSRRELLRLLAQEGAVSLEMRPLGDGSFSARVDRQDWFVLSPRLAQLLEILILRERPSGDRFPPWRRLEEVAGKLEEKVGRPFTPHAVTQLVSRLRRRLERAGVNPFLVATCRERGVRFLLADGSLRGEKRTREEAPVASESAGSGSSSSGGR